MMTCRHCNTDLRVSFADLRSSPPSNSYLSDIELKQAEKWYPLTTKVCTHCWLVQTEDFVGFDEMFTDEYAYFSSISKSWLDHAEQYLNMMIERFGFNQSHMIAEIAANDGYLLQFVKSKNIPCYGIEPTKSTALAAEAKGLEIIKEFFNSDLAQRLLSEKKQADLIIANNVLAHVPDINDFVKGFSILLTDGGIATFEFPHLLNLIKYNQFDTIYHEHFSYLSLHTVKNIFESQGLKVFDVEPINTHGGSLRVFACRKDHEIYDTSCNVREILEEEKTFGLLQEDTYLDFQRSIKTVKDDLIEFLLLARKQNKKIIAYGAAAKGNTLLNYCGVGPDSIPCVVDKNSQKKGKYLPGSRIPITDEEVIKELKPDYILVLPWNLISEIQSDLEYIKSWGGKFVTAIPKLKILE